MQKHLLVKVLRAITAAIDNLDQEELEQLIAGKGKLTFNLTEKSKKVGGSSLGDAQEVWQRLNQCKDRDEARQVLGAIPNRDALASFAKAQKIHVEKHDRREDIENKLIEFVIGGRLRTEAIQTLNLKAGGGN